MVKKMLLLAAIALFSKSLLCDIKVINQTGTTCIVTVEGVTQAVYNGDSNAKNFKVTIKDGKKMDEVSFAPEYTMLKFVRLYGPVPVIYRTKILYTPKEILLLQKSGAATYVEWRSAREILANVNSTVGYASTISVDLGLNAGIGNLSSDADAEAMERIKKCIKKAAALDYKSDNYPAEAEKIEKELLGQCEILAKSK